MSLVAQRRIGRKGRWIGALLGVECVGCQVDKGRGAIAVGGVSGAGGRVPTWHNSGRAGFNVPVQCPCAAARSPGTSAQ